jgi:hypothetical protein
LQRTISLSRECHAMPTFRIISEIDGQPTLDKPWDELYKACQVGGCVKVLSPRAAHTDRQRRWFKGILLKELSRDSGYSERQMEIKLISTIFPDDVTFSEVNHRRYPTVPSISKYNKRKMTQLIEESVPLCHEWGFDWVTYPDESLRS